DRRDRLRTDRPRAEDTFLTKLDQPATAAALTAQQRALSLGAVRGSDDDSVSFLEAASPAEHDQRAGAAVAVGGATHGAFGAVHLQVLALAAYDALGFDLVGPGILLGLPGEPLAFVVGEGLAGQHQGQLGRLLEGGELAPDPVILRNVGRDLGDRLSNLDGEHVTGILGWVWVGLDPLYQEGDVAAGQSKQLADQPETFEAGFRPLLQVQGEADGGVLDVDITVTLGRFREQGHQGV